MNKKEIIKKIKSIISNYGGFTTAEVEAEASPCISTMGSDCCKLAEDFYADKINAVIYVHENETGSEYLSYDELKKDVLEDILKLAQRWEEMQKEEVE